MRFHAARNYAHYCMQKGETIISPIAYGHQFATNYGARIDWKFWWALSERLILSSTELRILTLDGWQRSFGIAQERKLAENHGIPVTFAEPMR